jgi:CRP-like cAMP-binding protein
MSVLPQTKLLLNTEGKGVLSSVERREVEHFRKARLDAGRSAPIQAFAECKIFRKLSLEEIKEISAHAMPVRYGKGKLIFQIGEPANYLYIVQEGSVKLHDMAPSGKTRIFEISTSGNTLNGSALSTGAYFMSAQALTDVIVLRIAKDVFFGFVSRYPKLAMEIIHLLSSRLKTEYARMLAAQRSEVEQRLCQSLLSLCLKFGTTLHLTREELADYAGIATETTIRVLSRLKQAGVVTCSSHRREIIVADISKLRSAAVADEDHG